MQDAPKCTDSCVRLWGNLPSGLRQLPANREALRKLQRGKQHDLEIEA